MARKRIGRRPIVRDMNMGRSPRAGMGVGVGVEVEVEAEVRAVQDIDEKGETTGSTNTIMKNGRDIQDMLARGTEALSHSVTLNSYFERVYV